MYKKALRILSVWLVLVGTSTPTLALAFENFYLCTKENFLLKVQLADGQVTWRVSDLAQSEVFLSGRGNFQDEGQNAFSSISEQSAIAFKDNKVALVFPDDTAVVFICSPQKISQDLTENQ